MNKRITCAVILLLIVVVQAKAQKPDSIYFYKDGAIVYGEATTQIDSLTFHGGDYYDILRSRAIFNRLASYPELSTFTSLISSAGYRDCLTNKTIWAPTNASFQNLDPKELQDLNAVRRIVNNQLCDNLITTFYALGGSYKVRMLTGKNYNLSRSGSQYSLAGNNLLKSNIYETKSCIHIVDGMNSYSLNIWEYIQQAAGLDSLRSFIQSMNTTVKYYGVYVNGVYKDSLIVPKNDLFEYLAKINLEDSLYTALLPDNESFMETYNHLLPLCKSTSADLSQSNIAKWVLVRELFFRGKREFPIDDSILYSVAGTKYLHPDSLFLSASSSVALSNGLIYRVNHLKAFDPGFNKKDIRIEAEDPKSKLLGNAYEFTSILNPDSTFNISGGYFLNCKPTSTSSLIPLYVNVPIPNVFSMKYNVYVVFVPTVISDTTDKRPYKINFYLSTNANATSPMYTQLGASNQLTNATSITKLLVASNYEFTNSNIVHDPNSTSKITIRVRNMGGVSTTELKNYNRNMRIDYILLQPVE